MKQISTDTTVGDIVREVPARSRIFESLGIDFCCGGKKPLAEACRAKNLDPLTVVTMLNALGEAKESHLADADSMTLSQLCDHIEVAHHEYLRQELPRLDFMTRKVAAVHGDHEPRLHEVRRTFEAFQSEIASHTEEEEETIFPAIRRLEADKVGRPEDASRLKTSLQKLESEHDKAGAALASLNELTDSYAPPEWACNTFRALYDGLSALEKNMHQHVHKENNVLFPKVLAMGAEPAR